MKPLNDKERGDKFTKFAIAGLITLVITIFCFYYTSDFLTDAISINRAEKFALFQRYKQNQQQYTKQLQQINSTLTSNTALFSISDKIGEFKNSFTRKGDTSVLMKKIVALSGYCSDITEQRNGAKTEVTDLRAELKNCQKDLVKINSE